MTDPIQIRLTIPEGLYRLTEDVTNPKPDRRTRHSFWLSEVFEKGTYLAVRRDKMDLDLSDEGMPTYRYYLARPMTYHGKTLRFHTKGQAPHTGRVGPNDDDEVACLNAILPKLERVEPRTLNELGLRYQCNQDSLGSILEYLLAKRLVAFEDVQEAMRLSDEDHEEFWHIVEPEGDDS